MAACAEGDALCGVFGVGVVGGEGGNERGELHELVGAGEVAGRVELWVGRRRGHGSTIPRGEVARKDGGGGLLEEAVGEIADDNPEDQGEDPGGDVVEHDAGAFGQGFEAADGPGFGDVEEAEQREGCGTPVGRHEDEGEELTGDLVDDDEAGVLAGGLASDGGGGRDADEGDDDRGDEGCDGECGGLRWECVRGEEPEKNSGDAAVGSGAGLEVAGSEPGGEQPGPEGFLGLSH